MKKQGELKKGKTPLFKVKVGHIVLALMTVLMLVSLAAWSFYSMQVHETDKRQIFSQESESSALTFVQRESFSVLLKIEQWADKQATARDVQISRAMLAQRLAVQTDSGLRTSEAVGESYRNSLKKLDPVIRELAGVSLEDRTAKRAAVAGVINEFSVQTRGLSDIFQEVTRERISQVANERANAELIQTLTLVLIFIFSGSLATWITFDIVRGFRRANSQISSRQKKLDDSLNRLMLVQSMDERSRELIHELQDGLSTDEVTKRLKIILNELLPGNDLELEIEGFDIKKFNLTNPPELRISERDFLFLRERALEVLRTSLVHAEQKQDISFALQHDSLTGLANRTAFTSMVEEKAKKVNADGGVVGIFYVDIDRFGDLNSSMGYQTGDLVLVDMGFKISDSKKSHEFAARLSSDEFAIVGTYKNEIEARSRALTLQTALTFDLEIGAETASITVSMGCVISHAGQADASELQRCASLAIHLAKKLDRRSSFVTYNADDHLHLMTSWQEEIAVRNALATGEFKVFFQPIVELESRRPVGFEALIRWQRPGVGLVPPDQFLPLVNSAGLTAAVGADVLSESLRAWRQILQPLLSEAGFEDPYISINLEAVQLQDDEFVNFVLSEIEHSNVPHQKVQLEVTEHALVGGEAVITKLERLRDAGIKIALDDFGTGFSNLSQALKLPLDVLKMDKSLLLGVDDEEKSLRMVEDITKMAQGQELLVTAEGIETERIASLLARMKVDRGQGYLFGRAMPASEIAAWVEKQTKREQQT